MLKDIHDSTLHRGRNFPVRLLVVGVHRVVSDQYIRAKIRGEDNQSIPEIDLVSLAIGKLKARVVSNCFLGWVRS